MLLTSCNIDFFFPLNLGDGWVALKYNTTNYGLFPSLSMFRTLSPCQGLLTRDQPDLIWTPHTDWKYSISQDPSHIHQTQTSGLPIVRLAVLSQHGSLLVCHNCLGRQQLLHIGTSTNMFLSHSISLQEEVYAINSNSMKVR